MKCKARFDTEKIYHLEGGVDENFIWTGKGKNNNKRKSYRKIGKKNGWDSSVGNIKKIQDGKEKRNIQTRNQPNQNKRKKGYFPVESSEKNTQ